MAANTVSAELRSLTSGLLFWATGPWRYLKTRSRTQLLILSAVVLAVLGLGGFWAIHYLLLRTERQITRVWKSYDEHVKHGRLGEARTVLLELARLNPGNPRMQKRLECLETGQADPDDVPLLRALMFNHCSKNAFPAAVREAAKLVQVEPRSWEARFLLLADSYRTQDESEIKSNLEQMPFTGEAGHVVHQFFAVRALRLFSDLKDADRQRDMLEHMTVQVLPRLTAKGIEKEPYSDRITLLDCYQEILRRLDARPDLREFLAPAQAVARSVLQTEGIEAPALLHLAGWQMGHLFSLETFHRRGVLEKETFEDLCKETSALLDQTLARALARDRTYGLAYLCKAHWARKRGDAEELLRTVDEGLRNSKPPVPAELVALRAELLGKTSRSEEVSFLDEAYLDPKTGQEREFLREAPSTPFVLALYGQWAQSALEAGRLDRALAACRQAARRWPDLYWARRMEGDVCLQMGRPTEAYVALNSIRSRLSQDDKGVGLFVQALCAVGAADEAARYLEEIRKEKAPAKVLLSGAEALLVRADEVQLDGRSDEAARLITEAGRWALYALEQEAPNPRARQIYADSLRQRAETAAGTWDLPLVREAIKEYERVLLADENNLLVINNLVWLKLKALNAPEEAERGAAPLLKAENSPEMTPGKLGTLGPLYLRLGKIEQARQVLERAVRLQTRPSFYYHLAEVYLAQDRLAEAKTCLDEAGSLPRTARESLELEAVIKKLRAKQ